MTKKTILSTMEQQNNSLRTWLEQEMSRSLGFPSEEIVQYMLSMDSSTERETYLAEMLDVGSNPERINILEEFRRRNNNNNIKSKIVTPPVSTKEESKVVNENKTRIKYVNFYGNSKVNSYQLSGRHRCDCQATKHTLINNCLSCGRIVCSQEGSGPCLYCSYLVCTNDELDVVNRGSKKSEQLLKKLMSNDYNASRTRAEMHKNKLLEYDKSCEKRTKVIDDESDYFSSDSNQWLTEEQRAALKKKEDEIRDQRFGSRLNRKYTLDLNGKKVIESNNVADYDPSKDETLESLSRLKVTETQEVNNPNINCPRPRYVNTHVKSNKKKTKKDDNHQSYHRPRIQDEELQIMSDSGMCLSMHQPWASYLVAGIKLHEGRTWYSSHRGRLWIHSAAKTPDPNDVENLQKFYKTLYSDENLKFPTELPTSCLLGSIDVTDVLSKEEYQERYPTGESESPFVFLCENPRELNLKIPMAGKHKIYKLNNDIFKAVQKAQKQGPIHSYLQHFYTNK